MSRLPLMRGPTPERAAALAAVERGLDAADSQLWRTFITQNERGLRRRALAALDRLLAAIEVYSLERRAAWVGAVCHARWDASALERLPFPLLDRQTNPEDAKARAALIELFEADFDYYIHELPAGVLADAKAFAHELDQFEQLVSAH
jgi:hypothetical protein